MSEESHAEFMARIREMSSATYKSGTVRAAIVGSVTGKSQVEHSVRNGQYKGLRKPRPQAVKAGKMAAAGYGWEDIKAHCQMPDDRAKRFVFRKHAAWNAWVFGKRGARS